LLLCCRFFILYFYSGSRLAKALLHLPGLRGSPVLSFIFIFFIFFIPGSRLAKALPHLPGMRGPPEDEWCNGYLEEYLDMHGSELPGVANVLLMCF
jgi:hypothetical protein